MEGRETTDVFYLEYMTKLRFSLNVIGIWPNKVFGDGLKPRLLSILNVMLQILCNVVFMLEVIYLKKNKNVLGFIDLGHTYITTMMTVVVIQRLTFPWQKGICAVIKEFVLRFHTEHHKHHSEYSVYMNLRVNKICKIFCKICHFQMYFGLVMFNLVPLYKNYKTGMYSAHRPVNGTFEHSVYFYLPIDQFTDVRYYTLIFIYNWFASYKVTVIHCCVDLLIVTIVIHIWGHISVLKHDLEYFPRPKRELDSKLCYTDEENKDVFLRLLNIIKYHDMIKRFISDTSGAFGFSLCVHYAYHQIVGCVLLLECSSMDAEALAKYGPLTLVMFQQLVQMSTIFEIMTSKADTLIDAVYGLPWEYMDTRNRHVVMLLLQNVQKSLALKAGDMVPVGVTTMFAVLKTSFSYFMMLRTFGK